MGITKGQWIYLLALAVEFGAVALVGKLGDMNVASMEGVKSWYNQSDATGFIRLNGLRLRARHFAQGGPKL